MTSEKSDIKRKSNPLKTKVIVATIILLVLSLGFNALLSSSSLEKLYVGSLISSYRVVGKDLQRNLEKALRFGKNIKKFTGMNLRLNSTLQHMTLQSGDILQDTSSLKGPGSVLERYVAIALPDGKIIYSTNEKHTGSALPTKANIDYSKGIDENDVPKESHFVKHKSTYLVTLPIRDRKKNWVATAVLAFDESQVKALLNSALHQNIQTGGIALACGMILLLIILNVILPRERSKITKAVAEKTGFFSTIDFKSEEVIKFPRRKISIVMFLIIILCQVVFSFFSTNAFKEYYLNINKEKTIMLNTLLKEDIEYLLSKGLRINKLFKMEVMMGEILSALPEVNDITLLDREEIPLYMASKKGVINFSKDSSYTPKDLPDFSGEYNMRINVEKDGKIEGYLSTNLSREMVWSKIWETIWDSGTVLVISILFFVELLILIFQFLEKQVKETAGQIRINYRTIRPAAFLFLFGIDVSISFLPLHMEKLYEPIFGLSKDVVMGLPISVEMFSAGISLLIAGVWLDRRGWHQPFLTGLLLSGIGVLYSWLAPDALSFIVSRGVVGIGYGLSIMAAQGFVIQYSDTAHKGSGITQLFAGVYAGSICGGAAGAMLAERIGYNPVFMIGAIILFFVIGYTLIFMRDAMIKPAPTIQKETVKPSRGWQTLRFLFDRNIFPLILLSAFPAALALVGFINYFSPVYLNRIGASQSNIGRVYMIFGVCLIYIAPLISSFVDASHNKKSYIVISGLLGSLAFIIFCFTSGLAATALAVFFLGVSASFGLASQNAYALELNITKELGEGKAMGVFNSSERVGQVIGPILFGWILIAIGVREGITYFGIAYFLATLLFLLFAQSETKISGYKPSQT